MSVLNQKLKQDIRQKWSMLLAVSAIIAVGIGCFIAMMSAAWNLEQAKNTYYASTRLADFRLDLKKVPIQEVKRLTSISGLSEIRERILFNVVLDIPKTEKVISAMLISMPDKAAPVLNNITIRSGTYFTPGRAAEVIVGEKFAKARNIKPGDIIPAILNNQRKELVVVGTAISSEFVYLTSPGSLIDEPGNYGLLYIKRSFAEDTFGFHGACNNIIGLLSPEVEHHAEKVINQLSQRLKPYGVFTSLSRSELFSSLALDNEMNSLKKMAVTLPVFFLLVAMLILNVLMVRLAEQQRTVIGTLKALGYSNKILIIHFMKFALSAGMAGGVLGIILGYWLGVSITNMYVIYFTFPALISDIYPGLFSFGLLISILFSVIGTLKGIHQVLQLSPAESMRQAPPAKGGAILLEQFHGLWKRIGIQWQMILRGFFRNRGKTAVSVLSATMGSAIVVLAFGFVSSIGEMVDLQFNQVLKSDYHLTFHNEMDFSALDEIRRLPGVFKAEPVFNVSALFRMKNHQKHGGISGIIRNGKLTQPIDEQGNSIQVPESGLLMSRRLMEKLDISIGDSIEVTPAIGERKPVKLPVIQAISSLMGLMVYADYTWLNRILGHEKLISEIRVITSHNEKQKQAFMKQVRKMPGLASLTDLAEQKKAMNRQMDNTMRYMAVIMIIFAAVIFFGAILNGTLISLSERRRETATFRSMGYFEHEVAGRFLRENMTTNLIGTLIGLPLGHWLLVISMQEFSTDAYSFPAKLAPMSLLYTLILTIIFVLLSQLVVRRILMNENWVKAMSLKE